MSQNAKRLALLNTIIGAAMLGNRSDKRWAKLAKAARKEMEKPYRPNNVRVRFLNAA